MSEFFTEAHDAKQLRAQAPSPVYDFSRVGSHFGTMYMDGVGDGGENGEYDIHLVNAWDKTAEGEATRERPSSSGSNRSGNWNEYDSKSSGSEGHAQEPDGNEEVSPTGTFAIHVSRNDGGDGGANSAPSGCHPKSINTSNLVDQGVNRIGDAPAAEMHSPGIRRMRRQVSFKEKLIEENDVPHVLTLGEVNYCPPHATAPPRAQFTSPSATRDRSTRHGHPAERQGSSGDSGYGSGPSMEGRHRSDHGDGGSSSRSVASSHPSDGDKATRPAPQGAPALHRSLPLRPSNGPRSRPLQMELSQTVPRACLPPLAHSSASSPPASMSSEVAPQRPSGEMGVGWSPKRNLSPQGSMRSVSPTPSLGSIVDPRPAARPPPTRRDKASSSASTTRGSKRTPIGSKEIRGCGMFSWFS